MFKRCFRHSHCISFSTEVTTPVDVGLDAASHWGLHSRSHYLHVCPLLFRIFQPLSSKQPETAELLINSLICRISFLSPAGDTGLCDWESEPCVRDVRTVAEQGIICSTENCGMFVSHTRLNPHRVRPSRVKHKSWLRMYPTVRLNIS